MFHFYLKQDNIARYYHVLKSFNVSFSYQSPFSRKGKLKLHILNKEFLIVSFYLKDSKYKLYF